MHFRAFILPCLSDISKYFIVACYFILKNIRGHQADVERVHCIYMYLQKLPFNRCFIQFLYSKTQNRRHIESPDTIKVNIFFLFIARLPSETGHCYVVFPRVNKSHFMFKFRPKTFKTKPVICLLKGLDDFSNIVLRN